ncbi:HNH endonuclease [Spiroplasma endosymbiont of Aspidapion aeneum]|uniref:HNH endonuclease n=1 Tax=Spiroplasma endosymbiont of Aspidapion aeneum TaxID=3066276 RepID=UPI00313B7646
MYNYDERLGIWNKYSHVYNICKKEIRTIDEYEADYIIPHTNGGKTIVENAQILCKSCNASKNKY